MNGDKSLSQIWTEKAGKRWQMDFDDLNREQGGVQYARINRFLHGGGSFAADPDKKKNDEDAFIEMAEIARITQERLNEQFRQFYTEAREFYQTGLKKIDQMENELTGIETEYERRTIRLADGRAVYIDESGNYVYQDGGEWRALEETAIPEAKAQHAKLPAPAITKEQKDNLDDYKESLDSTKESMNRHNEELDALEEKRKTGELTEKEYKRAREDMKQDESALESLSKKRDRVWKGLDSSREIGAHNQRTNETKYTNEDISTDIFADDAIVQDNKRTISASGSAIDGAGQLTTEFASASSGAAAEQAEQLPPSPVINKPAATNPGMAG